MIRWFKERRRAAIYRELARLDQELDSLKRRYTLFAEGAREQQRLTGLVSEELGEVIVSIEDHGRRLMEQRAYLAADIADTVLPVVNSVAPPQLGERLLLLILTKDERVNIPGDLEEEYRGIAAKHGARYAKLWYYKQVAASAWPLIRKAVGWGALAWVGEWIRRFI